MSSHSPSAVVLIVDQITATMLGPYGNTQYDTPNFNRLAARSLLYDFAFANSSDLISAYHHFWQPSFKTHPDEPSLPAILSHAGSPDITNRAPDFVIFLEGEDDQDLGRHYGVDQHTGRKAKFVNGREVGRIGHSDFD